VITGTPVTTVTPLQVYNFVPRASDADGDPLRFQILRKPAWASFDVASGRLSGTLPATAEGSFADIQISVTDGKATTALQPFTITVTPIAPPVDDGTVVLTWTRPTRNVDGTTLTDLSGYRIYYGRTANDLHEQLPITSPVVTSVEIEQLEPGVWYFAISAYTKAGVESTRTGPVSKQIEQG
jgi:hypothetical protein